MENSGNNSQIPSKFSNINFEYNNEKITVNNETDLLNYIKKIDTSAINFEKKYKYKYLNKINLDEKEENKFIPLFQNKGNIYESWNGNIKTTINNSKQNIKNVFVLNNILEENQEFCFEIKLGNGYWDNMIDIKNNQNMKIGLLELNSEKIKKINESININSNKKLEIKENLGGWEGVNLLFNNDNNNAEMNKKLDEYKNSIFFSININNCKVPMSNKLININEENRLIQKNDIIGIVYNNKKFNDFIEMKIYINGNLIKSELIIKKTDSENDSDLDDEFKVEKNLQKSEKNNFLIPFIEFGDNKTIFIKDKEAINIKSYHKFITNENIEYIDNYKTPPLNYFYEDILELNNITKAYFDLLMKIGPNIFINKKYEINKFFFQLKLFFNNFVFINRIIAENCILEFLLKGINIENGNIEKFKQNLEALLNIINNIESLKEQDKIKLLEKIICLLIEIIMEKNTDFIDLYKNEHFQQEQFENLRKYKFILCFLLFDNFFMQEGKEVYRLLSKVSLFKYEHNIFNFCSTVFNSCLYYSPSNAEEYIKQFYTNNKFEKIKFLDINFRKYIRDKIYNKNFEDNNYKMSIILKEININNIEKSKNILKFIAGYCKSDDSVSIINLIIIQLIKNFFSKEKDINKIIAEKIINFIYINISTINKYNNENENTFYGKKENDHSSLSKINLTNDERKAALIFELIIKCVSNFYETFSLKEKKANEMFDLLSNKANNYKDFEIYKINHMIEFFQAINFGNFYLHLGYFTNYLLKFLLICIKEKYLDVVPYYSYLQNIFFILDMLKIRCSFIDKDNLVDKNETSIIYSNIDKILKYVTSFLGEILPKLKNINFRPKQEYENLISMNITILIKVLSFDKNIIKDSLPSIKENLIKTFKNLSDIYDKEKYKIIYNKINILIEFLYSIDNKEKNESIHPSIKNIFFKEIMAKEIDDYKNKLNEDTLNKNNYIEHTLYYNIFLIIYKRTKIIRESLSQIFDDNFLFEKNIFYHEKYLKKFTSILKIFHNFLLDNNLNLFYDTNNISFFKLNSFICKTYKLFHTEAIMKRLQNIYEKNFKIFEDFFTTFFFLSSYLLISKDKSGYEYYYQIAQNRKGFKFDLFKLNFEKYFGYAECKSMLEFLDILLTKFKMLCDDKDVLNPNDVNDNSIDMESRDQCSICLDYTDENDAHLNPCNHIFHMKCVKDMIAKNIKKCPLCKRNILGIKEDPTFIVDSNNNEIGAQFHNQLFPNNLFYNRGGLFGNLDSNASNRNESQSQRQGLFSNNDNRNINQVTLFNNNINFGGGLFGINDNSNNNTNNIFSNNNLFGNNGSGSLFG